MREEADGLGLLKTTPRPYRMGLGLYVCCSRLACPVGLQAWEVWSLQIQTCLHTLCTKSRIQFNCDLKIFKDFIRERMSV